MVRAGRLGAEAQRFRELRTSDQVLDVLTDCFRSLGAAKILVTGIPLPGRPLQPLVLRQDWGELEGVAADDAVFPFLLGLRGAEVIASPPAEFAARSPLYRTAAAAGATDLICVPVRGFLPFQGAVIAAGAEIESNRMFVLALDYFCEEAFRQLLVLEVLTAERPGDLSGRERRVVELSAEGKTASDIAETLAISQRTVHAHLQNASDKLRARNKTQTVVEALRYGQIRL
jgi:DNA-binding CsgD family transcriptional regulator